MILFTSRDIGQYVYYICLLTGCDVIKFAIDLVFNQAVLVYEQKAFFIILKGLPVAKNCLIPDSEPLTAVLSECEQDRSNKYDMPVCFQSMSFKNKQQLRIEARSSRIFLTTMRMATKLGRVLTRGYHP